MFLEATATVILYVLSTMTAVMMLIHIYQIVSYRPNHKSLWITNAA